MFMHSKLFDRLPELMISSIVLNPEPNPCHLNRLKNLSTKGSEDLIINGYSFITDVRSLSGLHFLSEKAR